jgi:hypothetical protein
MTALRRDSNRRRILVQKKKKNSSMKNVPWAHDKNVSKTLSFPLITAIQE